jgi:hypothetical protein
LFTIFLVFYLVMALGLHNVRIVNYQNCKPIVINFLNKIWYLKNKGWIK